LANPIPYDATAAALFHPESQPPLRIDAGWSEDAVAAEFSRLSYVRYEDGAAQQQIVAGAAGQAGYGDVGFFNDPRGAGSRGLGAQGFAARNAAGHAIIAFRGTQPDSLRDILTNANALPVRWLGPGRTHRGFWQSLEAVLPQVDAWLAGHPPARLTITGHSLGAALATLLAARMPAAELINFGSPRAGTATLARSFEGRPARRYVDCTDLVVGVPPAIGYAHIEPFHYIDAAGRLHPPGAPGRPSLMRDSLRANAAYLPLIARPGNVPARALADHAPINYVSAILGRRTGP
jgi:hypothetical protein